MNESQFWNKVRGAFKARRGALAWKVQDAYRSGLPDVDAIVNGHVVKLELKYANGWPPRGGALQTTLKPTQRAHLIAWADAGGDAFILLGVGKKFYVIDPTNLAWHGSKFYKEDVESTCEWQSDALHHLVEWIDEGCPFHFTITFD